MAADQTEERASLLKDMNGNGLREGDLVIVLLEKPVLVGFITAIKEPSVLTARDKNPPGVLTVTGTISIPFAPNQIQFLRQTAKLVDPRSEALVNALSGIADIPLTKKEPTAENSVGPSLVPATPSTVDESKG